jgi:hypothetical protein
VLIDVHEDGAGLLVPRITFDAIQVWMQFLWFDDRVGLQGRVIFVREVKEGYHVGLQLELVHPESVKFLTSLLIPYSMRKLEHDHPRGISLQDVLSHRWVDEGESAPHHPYLPVLVAQEGLSVWAITEYRDEAGAVLLLPQQPDANVGLALTTWGQQGARWANVARSEELDLSPIKVYRITVEYQDHIEEQIGNGGQLLPKAA